MFFPLLLYFSIAVSGQQVSLAGATGEPCLTQPVDVVACAALGETVVADGQLAAAAEELHTATEILKHTMRSVSTQFRRTTNLKI